MSKVLIKILVFGLILFIPLLIIQIMVDKGMRKNRSQEYGVWNDIYDSKINTDILVIGSSRALVNISSPILDSALNTPTYGIGVDGGNFEQTITRLKVFLQHNKKPTTIIYSIGMRDLEKSTGLFRMEQYMPYLADSIIKNSNQGYTNSFIWADYYVPLMKYRTNFSSVLTGIKLYFSSGVEVIQPRVLGHESRDMKWDTSFEDFKKSGKTFDIKINGQLTSDFRHFLDLCKANQIQVIFVYSPEYIEIQSYFKNRDFLMDYYRKTALTYNIPFLDFSKHNISYHKKYFYNSEHLNKVGSEIFSKKLSRDLLKYIKHGNSKANLQFQNPYE